MALFEQMKRKEPLRLYDLQPLMRSGGCGWSLNRLPDADLFHISAYLIQVDTFLLYCRHGSRNNCSQRLKQGEFTVTAVGEPIFLEAYVSICYFRFFTDICQKFIALLQYFFDTERVIHENHEYIWYSPGGHQNGTCRESTGGRWSF